MDSYDQLLYEMSPEEMLSEGLVDVLDLPYDPRGDDRDDDSSYYAEKIDRDDGEDEIRF